MHACICSICGLLNSAMGVALTNLNAVHAVLSCCELHNQQD